MVTDALKRILTKAAASYFPDVMFCDKLNISVCEVTEKNDMVSVLPILYQQWYFQSQNCRFKFVTVHIIEHESETWSHNLAI